MQILGQKPYSARRTKGITYIEGHHAKADRAPGFRRCGNVTDNVCANKNIPGIHPAAIFC
jgi:hypothetical protein